MILTRRKMMLGAATGLGAFAAKPYFTGVHAQGLSGANALRYKEADVPNPARFRGKLSYSGPPVVPTEIPVNKDSEICGDGFRSIQPLRVGNDAALTEAVVEVRGITAGKPWPSDFDTTKIYQIECSFQPFVQIGKSSADIEIFNYDPICLLYTSPSPRDRTRSRMPSSA